MKDYCLLLQIKWLSNFELTQVKTSQPIATLPVSCVGGEVVVCFVVVDEGNPASKHKHSVGHDGGGMKGAWQWWFAPH